MTKGEKRARTPRSKGIAGTYIHISEVPFGLSHGKALLYLEEHASGLANEHFKRGVVIRVRVEEGSLKAWVLVGAIGMGIADFISDYGAFRSGIDYLVDDSRHFSERLIEQFQIDEGIEEEAVLRTERRLGVPGKIQRFYKRLDKLNDLSLSHHDRAEMLDELKSEFVEILELLESNQDRRLFMEEIPSEVKQPDMPKPEPIPGVIDLAILRDEDEWD